MRANYTSTPKFGTSPLPHKGKELPLLKVRIQPEAVSAVVAGIGHVNRAHEVNRRDRESEDEGVEQEQGEGRESPDSLQSPLSTRRKLVWRSP